MRKVDAIVDERWWLEFEHAQFGVVKVLYRWRAVGKGVYEVVPGGVEFDLWTPQEVREEVLNFLGAVKARAVVQ